MKKRIDVLIFEKDLARSRTAAAELVKRKMVMVDEKHVTKPSDEFEETSLIHIIKPLPFVSRGGEKLQAALEAFSENPKGLTVADIGSSTGGFTDCLLQYGAQKIYAIDVGTNQLDSSLRNNPRISVFEQTDIRKVQLPELVDLAVIDVSFISLTQVLPAVLTLLKKNAHIIALVKPQFEVGQDYLNRQGVVTNSQARKDALEKIHNWAIANNVSGWKSIESPLLGGTGNVEYLVYMQKGN